MFNLYESWEDTHGVESFVALFGQPTLRRFPFVEIPLNVQLFHLDVAPVDDESRWQRFIFNNIYDVFDFVASENIKDIRIALQSRRADGVGYKIKPVRKIFSGTGESGSVVLFFLCTDGTVELNNFCDEKIENISDKNCLWSDDGSNMSE